MKNVTCRRKKRELKELLGIISEEEGEAMLNDLERIRRKNLKSIEEQTFINARSVLRRILLFTLTKRRVHPILTIR